MKVIKVGVRPEDRPWKGTCRACKSVVEAKESELNNIQDDPREGGKFCWAKCPVCGVGAYGGLLFYPKRFDDKEN